MSLLAHAVTHSAGHMTTHAAHGLERFGWLGKGFHGLNNAAQLGLGAAFGYYNYSHDYGMGGAAIYAAASYCKLTSIPLLILTEAYSEGNAIYQHQKEKRRPSFAKAEINDTFGTISKMRQYSHQQLLQDHSSRGRVIGNEAFYLHR